MRRAAPALTIAAALLLAAPGVFAKLPPPSDEAKAKAAEAAAKTAWTDKVGAYKQCQAMDRAAARYRKGAGASAAAAVETPACVDPGPFVAPAPPAASGAIAAAAAPPAATKK